MNDTVKKTGNMIQSVDRALSLIDCIASNNGEYGLSEIARAMGLNKATVYGLLATLEKHQYITLSPDTKKYGLGIRLVELGSKVECSMDIRKEAKPYMDKLAEKYQTSAHLGIESNNEVLYVDVSISNYSLPTACRVGFRLPCYCSGVGKAIMAYWPEEKINTYLQTHELKERTVHTLTSHAAVRSELELIKHRGYAIDDEENQLGVIAFSGPIFGLNGEVVAGISVGILKATNAPKLQEEIITDIISCSRALSMRLGYHDASM